MDINFLIIKLFILYSCHLCLGYREYKLEGYDICASNKIIKPITDFINRNPIKLDNGPNSAVIIHQNWNSTYYPKMKTECKFRIISKIPKSGIYIVITKLQFRKDPITNSCIDYIEFSQHSSIFNIFNNHNENIRTCKNFGVDETKTHLLFFDYEKEVHITVFVDQKIKILEPLEINIVATAHFDCGSTHIGFQCDPKNNSSCIYENFVNDRIINCIQTCKDETDCSLEPLKVKKIDTSNVVLSAITSLIFTMIGVGTCLWLCWKYKECMSLNEQDNSRNEQHQQQQQQNEISSLQTTQTGNTEIQRPPSPKEDPPPSYESLFPDR